MPFFILGWKAREWRIVDRWQGLGASVWWVRAGALAVFAAWLGVVGAFIQTWRDIDLRFWFFYDDSYSGLGLESWWAGAIRFGLIVVAVVLCAAFLALVPRRAGWMTDLGKGTMYVYLLHSFVLYPIRESGFLTGEHASASWLVLMIVASAATSLVLSSRTVRRVFRPLIEPRAGWLFAHQPEEPPSLPRVAHDVARDRDAI
jgi:fucose 4-O-acetylase-like acetyltransferase